MRPDVHMSESSFWALPPVPTLKSLEETPLEKVVVT
jgi:hypothetical protein